MFMVQDITIIVALPTDLSGWGSWPYFPNGDQRPERVRPSHTHPESRLMEA